MLESMTGEVGFAMHEDRLAKAMRNQRLTEAEQLRNSARVGHSPVRDTLARGLTALAMRLAPGDASREVAPA